MLQCRAAPTLAGFRCAAIARSPQNQARSSDFLAKSGPFIEKIGPFNGLPG